MFKSYIFASMYTVVGMTGWGAYSTIATEDTSVTAIQNIAASAIAKQQSAPVSKSLYRWRDHEGNWQYGEIPTTDVNMTNYEQELALLRKLPREVLPTQALKQAEKENSFFEILPSLTELASLMNIQSGPEAQQDTAKAKQLMEETKKLKQTMEQHNQLLQEISRQ